MLGFAYRMFRSGFKPSKLTKKFSIGFDFGIHHNMTTEIHSHTRGKVTQPCKLMVVEVRLYILMDAITVIVVEYPDNKYLRH